MDASESELRQAPILLSYKYMVGGRTFLILILSGVLCACAKKSALDFQELDLASGESTPPVQSGSQEMNPLFQCQQKGSAAPTPIRKLTFREMTNTLKDLLGGFGQGVLLELETQLNYVPKENSVLGYDNIEFSISLPLVEAHLSLFDALSDKILSSTTRIAEIAGECMNAATPTTACIQSFVTNFGLKVFRRPLLSSEVSSFVTLYNQYTSSKTEAIKAVLMSLFMNPNFHYRLENQGNPVDGTRIKLTGYEIASKLSYMIWGTLPDSALFVAAANGELETPSGLKTQLDRLLKSARAKENMRYFFGQWLGVLELPSLEYSNEYLEGVSTAGLSAEAQTEIRDFIDYIVWDKKGSLTDLLLDRTAYVKTNRLAQLYGTQSDSLPIQLNGQERAGVLTRLALLLSGSNNSSPFKRGSTVMTKLLCYTPDRPDPDTLPQGALNEPAFSPTLSTRERFEAKTSSAQCMTCHSTINPLSFSLGAYDNLGRYRQGHEKIFDPQGHLVGQASLNLKDELNFVDFKKEIDGPLELSQTLADMKETKECFVIQWYRFSQGKAESTADSCLMSEQLTASASSKGILDMISSTVTNSQFVYKSISP